MADTLDAATAAFDSTFIDNAPVAEKPLSDVAFEAPPVQETADEPKVVEPKGKSTRDSITEALDKVEAEGKEPKPEDEKAAKEETPKSDKARAEDGKFAKAKEPETPAKVEPSAPEKVAQGQEADPARQSEGRKHVEPPARFLPEARQKWANVPNEVKAEFHRVTQEYDSEIERSRPAVEAYESVKEYDEMAKGAGTTMKDAMRNYVEIDKLLISNPAQGLARILQSINISPEQLAEALAKNPQAFKVQATPKPADPQPSPQVQQLQQQNQQLQQELIRNQALPIINSFAAAHPDYKEREQEVFAILKSGVIDQLYGTGLSPEQRLAQAYRMAGGSPSHPSPEAPPANSDAPQDRPVDPAGQMSIRGAPHPGFDPQVKRPKNNREAAEAALDALGL